MSDGVIIGKVNLTVGGEAPPANDPFAEIVAGAIDTTSGHIRRMKVTDGAGNFDLSGLDLTKYSVFAQKLGENCGSCVRVDVHLKSGSETASGIVVDLDL